MVQNRLYRADCKDALQKLIDEGVKVDLIYLDPPFCSGRDYYLIGADKSQKHAFSDRWVGIIEMPENLIGYLPHYLISFLQHMGDNPLKNYLLYMTERLVIMKKILKDTGSIYYHCDPTASHYIKIILDGIFGEKNFRNEIVWCYKENETALRWFPRKHDIIFFYVKNEKAKYIFNIQRGDFTEAQLKRYNHIGEDGARYANMKGKMRKLEGGAKLRDWWDIPIAQASERLGYPTQKPEALLDRIIKASCPEGGLVLDPFCGCGTTVISAIRNQVNWIGIDISCDAIEIVKKRINKHPNH